MALNETFCKMLGREREEIINQSICTFTEEDQEKTYSHLKKIKNKGTGIFESKHRRKNGEVYDLEISSTYVNTDGGSYICFGRDITDRKLIEKEKNKMQAKLFHSAKLASIGTLAAGVAHEINNPLTIVKGFTLAMLDSAGKEKVCDPCRKILEKMDYATDRISSIVNQLKLLARTNEDSCGPVDLHRITNETISLVQSIYKNVGIQIETKYGSHNPMVLGNVGKIQQILLNLLSNAKDAIQKNANPGLIVITTMDKERYVLLELEDNGCGMDPDQLNKIFDPFYTTKDPGAGTGLGLSISKALMQEMGGTISVLENKHNGATFLLKFCHQR